MAKFLIVLALASAAAAIDSFGYRSGFGGGSAGFGYPIGNIGAGGYGISKHINSVGSSYGGIGPLGVGGVGVGVSKHISSTAGSSYGGLGPIGIGGLGVSKQYSTVGSSVGGLGPYGGIGGIGLSKQLSVGGHHGYGGLGYGSGIGGGLGLSKVSSIGVNNLGHGAFGGMGLGALGGIGGLGFAGMSGLSGYNRFAIPAISTLPGGYYGGIISYPQVIPTGIHTGDLHIPHSAMDSYKGYYGGYFPGSVGYGHSYRFFH